MLVELQLAEENVIKLFWAEEKVEHSRGETFVQ